MERKRNGFTLVELLAVIVVLAIIMVLAIPQVIDSLDAAKKNTFSEYCSKVLIQAQTKYNTDVLDGNPGSRIYVIGQNNFMPQHGNYEGIVVVESNNGSQSYKVYLTDGERSWVSTSDLTVPSDAKDLDNQNANNTFTSVNAGSFANCTNAPTIANKTLSC